jgi:hypothetical protein
MGAVHPKRYICGCEQKWKLPNFIFKLNKSILDIKGQNYKWLRKKICLDDFFWKIIKQNHNLIPIITKEQRPDVVK